ncbi:Odorant receptor 2a [Camponotus floridanus]|uniref:Odorant receptor n=1 Tax=Camponotus floridanus TaxID=104421 RepID=E2A3X8_CAMFO|nr:Odorant receptor 2a [Camponotus floridanus]
MSFTTTMSPTVEFGLRAIGIWPGSPRSMLYRTCWTISLGLAQTFQFRYIVACIKTNNFLDLVDSISTTLPYSLLCLKLIILWLNQRLLWSIVMGTGLIFQYRYLLTHFSIEELPNLIDGLSTTLPYTLLFFKLIILWINNRIFNDILRTMSNDWYEYSSIYTMIDKANLSHRYSKLVIGVYSTAVLLYSIATIDFRKPINDDCRQLLIKMELPFVFCESPIYEFVACVQFVHLMVVASTIGMLDALIVTLSLGTNEGVRMLIKTAFFYIAIVLEAFIFCFSGEYLSNKSRTIGDATYESLWYALKPRDSRILLFVIMRSQTRLTITAGKFMDLSLEGFTSVRFL